MDSKLFWSMILFFFIFIFAILGVGNEWRKVNGITLKKIFLALICFAYFIIGSYTVYFFNRDEKNNHNEIMTTIKDSKDSSAMTIISGYNNNTVIGINNGINGDVNISNEPIYNKKQLKSVMDTIIKYVPDTSKCICFYITPATNSGKIQKQIKKVLYDKGYKYCGGGPWLQETERPLTFLNESDCFGIIFDNF